METKIEQLTKKNHCLSRQVNKMQQKAIENPFLYPYWGSVDWDKVYDKSEE